MRNLTFIAFFVFIVTDWEAYAQVPDDPCANADSAVWHDGNRMADLWRGICAKEALQRQRTQAAEQQKQEAYAQARAQALAAQRLAIEAAANRGYRLVSNFDDLILDGKSLAASHAKIQVTGYYRKVGDEELLYASASNAFQGTGKFIPVLTGDAVRPLREQLLTYICSSPQTGCQISVGGYMQLCHYLNAQFANYSPVPCLNVTVAIQ